MADNLFYCRVCRENTDHDTLHHGRDILADVADMPALLRDQLATLQSRLTEMAAREAVYHGLLLLVRDSFLYAEDDGIGVMEEAENHHFDKICNVVKDPTPGAARLVDVADAAKAWAASTRGDARAEERLINAIRALTTTSESAR